MKRIAALLLLASAAYAQPLPPSTPWSGKSRELIVAADDPWITPSEKSAFRFTPSYDETVAWLRRLVAAAPELRMVSIGKSGENRDIWMVIASKDRAFTPEALKRSGKPILLAQAGIHAGEIDGKDAGLLLLRDMTVRGKRRELLDRANFLFVPIFNVDGHERISAFGRVNQRGPERMGWRTNAQNLNLNRDYAKLDTPEVRAIVAAIERWSPDLYVDLHVTDGADYQYDVTWGWNRRTGWSPSIARWLDDTLQPALERDLKAAGHIPGPLVFAAFGDDITRGITFGEGIPRFSTGWGDARHLAAVLVENHSLKPYEQRVLGMRVLLESMMVTLGSGGAALRRATDEDRRRRIDPVVLTWEDPEKGKPSETLELLGIESRTALSPISGTVRTEYLGRPITLRVPAFRDFTVTASVPRAKAYWIPAQWNEVADRLRRHGIAIEQITAPRDLEVDMYRLVDPKLKSEAFEGRVQFTTRAKIERRKERFAAGSWRVSTDQPLGQLASLLLEPESGDSFLQWGFFLSILQRTEYIESYIVEPLAEKMLADDPKLAEEFRRKVAGDAAFRADSTARLRWFYERSPYWDERWLLYPVARER